MDYWSNEKVLEFIDLLEGEPCIWNFKSKINKNRNLVSDAWIRIQSKLSGPCTVDELKRKRNSLLTTYRECLKKIKESTRTGSDAEEIYRPSWFAFDAMNNSLGSLYGYSSLISPETQESADESPLSHEAVFKFKRSLSDDSIIERSASEESNGPSGSDYYLTPKRQHANHGMQDSLCRNKDHEKETDECDLYGRLLAKKFKALDESDRLVLMNEIDNTVFKYIMNVREKKRFNDKYENQIC